MKYRKIKVFCDYLEKEIDAILLKKCAVLYVSEDFLIAANGYRLYKYDIESQKWQYFSRLLDFKYSLLSLFSFTKRLFRAEITHLYKFKNDTWMCIAKKGIFKLDIRTQKFKKYFLIKRGSRPMNLCQDNNGVVYFGDYYYNPGKNPMNIYKSIDNGESWTISYTFPKGTINHIHGIFNDPYSNKIWVTTGDTDSACIFGYTEDGFESIIPEFQGSQKYRVCVPLFYKDKIVYATDSQYEQNVIRAINRKTGEIKDLCKIQGSGIYALQTGNMALISTTVEPSEINTDLNSFLWLSSDGEYWKQVLHYRKDCWRKTYFQFGTMRFPEYENSKTISDIIVIGQALKQLDNSSLVIPCQKSIFK